MIILGIETSCDKADCDLVLDGQLSADALAAQLAAAVRAARGLD